MATSNSLRLHRWEKYLLISCLKRYGILEGMEPSQDVDVKISGTSVPEIFLQRLKKSLFPIERHE